MANPPPPYDSTSDHFSKADYSRRRQYRHGRPICLHFISKTLPMTHVLASITMSLRNANCIIIFGDDESSYPIPNPTPFPPKIFPDFRQSHEWSWSELGEGPDPPPSYARASGYMFYFCFLFIYLLVKDSCQANYLRVLVHSDSHK